MTPIGPSDSSCMTVLVKPSPFDPNDADVSNPSQSLRGRAEQVNGQVYVGEGNFGRVDPCGHAVGDIEQARRPSQSADWLIVEQCLLWAQPVGRPAGTFFGLNELTAPDAGASHGAMSSGGAIRGRGVAAKCSVSFGFSNQARKRTTWRSLSEMLASINSTVRPDRRT